MIDSIADQIDQVSSGFLPRQAILRGQAALH